MRRVPRKRCSTRHGQGIIHRDLKPQNVLLTAQGQCAIYGLRIGQNHRRRLQSHGDGPSAGNPVIYAAEQAAGRTDQIGPLADVYSMGATLYCLLTGRPPFRRPPESKRCSMSWSGDRPRRGCSIPQSSAVSKRSVSKRWRRNRNRGIARQNIGEDLGRFLAGEPILGRRQGLLSRAWRKVRRNSLTSLLVALTFVAVVGVAAAVMNYPAR